MGQSVRGLRDESLFHSQRFGEAVADKVRIVLPGRLGDGLPKNGEPIVRVFGLRFADLHVAEARHNIGGIPAVWVSVDVPRQDAHHSVAEARSGFLRRQSRPLHRNRLERHLGDLPLQIRPHLA